MPSITRKTSKKADPDRRRVNGRQLAAELGVDPSAITDFKKRGVIEVGQDGLFDLELTKLAIAARVRPFGKTAAKVNAQKAAGTVNTDPKSKAASKAASVPPDATAFTYQTARATREQEEARLAGLKRQQLERRLIDREATLAAVFTAFRTLRDQVMPVGRRLAGRLASMNDARDIQQAIDDELRLVLRQFAEKTLTTAAGRIAGPDSKPVDRDWIEESTQETA